MADIESGSAQDRIAAIRERLVHEWPAPRTRWQDKDVVALLAEVDRLREALTLAAVRLEICADRMHACHEETNNHGLLSEAKYFIDEARAALAGKEGA